MWHARRNSAQDLVAGALLAEVVHLDDRRRVGVEGANPDFVMLARACRCYGVDATTLDELQNAFRDAFAADRPTVIVCHENRAT